MALYFVDPPSGWMYGFPKIWDSEKDKPIPEWLAENGYPEKATHIRTWSVGPTVDGLGDADAG